MADDNENDEFCSRTPCGFFATFHPDCRFRKVDCPNWERDEDGNPPEC